MESGLLIWVLCLLSGGVMGTQGGGSCLGVEGTGRRLECLWGLVGSLWAGAEECGGYGAGAGIICVMPAGCCLLPDFC